MMWTDTCRTLWGDDWIAPAAEFLDVNRRTVERWKSGAVTIPPHVERRVSEIPIPDDPRPFGHLLRRLVRGEEIHDLQDWIDRYQDALDALRRMRELETRPIRATEEE